MSELIGGLLASLPILTGFGLVWAANVPRSRRQQQYPLPFVSVIYVCVALWALHRFNLWYDSLLELVFGWLPFLESWYQVRWQYGIQNLLILLGFVVLKLILRAAVLARFFVGEHFLGSRFVAEFYEYDARTGDWHVRPRLAKLRTLLLVVLLVSLVVTVAIIIAARAYPAWPMFQAIPYPAVPVIVLGECYFALAGLTRQEADDDIYGEEDVARRRVDYAGLRHIYRDQFGDRILDDASRLAGPHLPSAFDSVRSLQKSVVAEEAAAGSYFDQLRDSGVELDPSYVNVAVSITGGSSALICNPFYNDLTDYIALPLHVRLLQGETCLVIAGRNGSEDGLLDWVGRSVESVSGIPGLWNVTVLRQYSDAVVDVGLLRAADLHNVELLRTHEEFFARVGLIVVVEPSLVLSTGQLGLRLVSERCQQGNTPPTVVALDNNHDGLVDALSQLFAVEITTVVASPVARGANSMMVWQPGGDSLTSKYMPAISRQLGAGVEIGAVALKYHVSDVDWVGGSTVPVHDLLWIAGQYYPDLTAFAELEASQHALTDPLVPWTDPARMEQRPNRFIVAEDEACNLYEAERLLMTRSTHNGFVHIVSGDYYLRDYMLANRAIFEADPKAIPSIVPDYAQTERAVTIRLIASMELDWLAERALRRELDGLGIRLDEAAGHRPDAGEPWVLVELRELIARHTGVVDVTFHDEVRRQDVTDAEGERYYRIASGTGLHELLRSLRSAYFIVEDAAEDRDYIGSCLYGHVFQTFLPGQFITHVGKHYEVVRVTSTADGDCVILRRAADHVRGTRVYRPLLSVTTGPLEEVHDDAEPRQVSGIGSVRVRAEIQVASAGFVESSSRGDTDGRRVEFPAPATRSYTNKESLKILLPGVEPEARRALAHALNELFVTIFPHSHAFVWAITEDQGATFGDRLPQWTDAPDDGSILIIEDSMLDLGLIVSVERHLVRLLEIIADVTAWQLETADAAAVGSEAPTEIQPEVIKPEAGVTDLLWPEETTHPPSVELGPEDDEPVAPDEEPAELPVEEER